MWLVRSIILRAVAQIKGPRPGWETCDLLDVLHQAWNGHFAKKYSLPCSVPLAEGRRDRVTQEGLLAIYEQARINPDTPECIFAETLIFSEGWMLRAATHSLRSVQVPAWLEERGHSAFGFLPFPPGVVAYSEAQLYTPFRKRARADPLGEARPSVRASARRHVGHVTYHNCDPAGEG
jgi:hypothetical protein